MGETWQFVSQLLIECFPAFGKKEMKLCKLTWREIYGVLISEKTRSKLQNNMYDEPHFVRKSKQIDSSSFIVGIMVWEGRSPVSYVFQQFFYSCEFYNNHYF